MRVRMLSVYCILEVRYCITGVSVYMDMNFVDKNLTDLSYLTTFFCIVNLSHCKREKKRFPIILAGTMCTFPISFYMCACVSMRECVSVCVCVQFNSDIWLFWCNKVCLL